MDEDTKKISLADEIDIAKELSDKIALVEASRSWGRYILWLKEVKDEALLLETIEYELANACRPQFLDRVRTRFNKLRSLRELHELEDRAGMVINVNYVGER